VVLLSCLQLLATSRLADLPLPGPGPADEPLALTILSSGVAPTELKKLGMRKMASGTSSTTGGRIVAGGGEERRELITLPD
jgi:hypothetical protein